jgi:hypothetical protein
MLSAPRDARLHLQTDILANPNDAVPRPFHWLDRRASGAVFPLLIYISRRR